MSAYLSPIMSSGDTTPTHQSRAANEGHQMMNNYEEMNNSNSSNTNINSQQIRGQTMNDERNKSNTVNPFQSRVEISAGEIAQKLRQNKLKSQQSGCTAGKHHKTAASLRSMGNSILLDESSASSRSSSLDNERDISTSDELEQRAVAKALVLDSFRKRHEQAEGEQFQYENEEDDEDELADEDEDSEAFALNVEKSRNLQQQQQTQTIHSHSRKPQTLAEQFLQDRDNKQQQPPPKDAFRLNYDQSSGKRQLRELLADFSARSSQLTSGGQRLNKKFKQILHSLPTMPTLLATTSLMTLILLLCLLLLSDTPRATALRDERQDSPSLEPAPLETTATATATTTTTATRQQAHSEQADGEFKFVLDGAEPAALRAPEPTRAALQRELIKDIFLAQAARPQQARHHLQVQQQHELRNHHHQQQQQQPSRSSGRLPPQLARVRSSSKRNSEQHDFDALASEQLELNDQPVAQHQPEAAAVNLFDSLGSMLFGAAQQQQQQQQQSDGAQTQEAELGEPLNEAAAFLDGEPALSSALRAVEGGGGGGSSSNGVASASQNVEQEPARLRSSPLELDLSPDQLLPGSTMRSGPASNSRPRATQHKQPHRHQATPTAIQQQQQQPHDSNRHHANNHERPFDVALVQCNNTVEGFERFACPSPDHLGRFRCIEDRLFCDGYYDCPNGEDEDRVHCMYYRLFVSHIDILTNTFLTWMKNQNRQTSATVDQHSPAGAASTSSGQHHNHHTRHHITTDSLDA